MHKSRLEALFAAQVKQGGLRAPMREYKFCRGRRWRLDFAWPEDRVAVEIDGGTWQTTKGGRSAGHAHPARMRRDNEKRNTARAMGWRVFQFTSAQVLEGEAYERMRSVLDDSSDGSD